MSGYRSMSEHRSMSLLDTLPSTHTTSTQFQRYGRCMDVETNVVCVQGMVSLCYVTVIHKEWEIFFILVNITS